MNTKRRSAGFTILELLIVVFIIGVLSALIGSAYMKNVKRSRTAEAVGHLQKMWAGAISYYEADHAMNNGVMADKEFPCTCDSFTDDVEPDCCSQSPNGHCLGNDPAYTLASWQALHFNVADTHLYVPRCGGCPDEHKNLWVEAWGDLDCDGTHSVFTRKANVGPSGDVEGYLSPAVVNELE